MRLEGSCQCGSIRFSVDSATYQPYMRCYCSICRKASGGTFAINLGADNRTLAVADSTYLGYFNSVVDGEQSQGQRHFCTRCGTALWMWDPRWPELVHPLATVIDTELPSPPQTVHIMLASKPAWITADIQPGDLVFDGYPEESISDWHARHGLTDDA